STLIASTVKRSDSATSVHGERQAMLARIPPTHDPAQQGRKAQVHLHRLPMRSLLLLARVTPFAQALPHGGLGLLEQRSEDGHHAGDATRFRQHHPITPPR